MSSTRRMPAARSDNGGIMLGVLNAVQKNEHVTQRSVAHEVGIALGLANAYLRRCARKGLIKIRQAPANRYRYYLTPKGFAEKSRLTAEYLSNSFLFFRSARAQCTEALMAARARGWRRIAFYGASELAEVASLCEVEGVEIVATVDPGRSPSIFARLPVVASLKAAGEVDAVLLTELGDPQAVYNVIADGFPAQRILVPALLRVSERDRDAHRDVAQ